MANVARMIDVDRLYFSDNVRSPECMAIPGMVESFRRHGFKVNHPLVVSEKPGKSKGDPPMYLVLVGNRRGQALHWLRKEEEKTYQQILPTGKVPAIVHKGLTREEEVDLRIDHSVDEDRVPLDEWSIFLAIKQLVGTGADTQDRIATKLGLFKTTGKGKGQPRREYVQVRVNLVRLPSFVQDEIRKLTLDKDSTLIRWNHIPRLYKVYNAEYTTCPGGAAGKGPEFTALWKELTTPPEPTAEGETEGPGIPKELSPADAIKRSQAATSKGLKQALLVVTRQSKKDLGEIDAHLVAAESALLILHDIQAYLGDEEYGKLKDAAIAQGETRRSAAQSEKERTGSEEVGEVAAVA